MTEVKEVEPIFDDTVIPSADWADAYSVEYGQPFADVREAGNVFVESFPSWMQPMLRLRDGLTSLAGLKGTDELARQIKANSDMDAIGFFPIVSETENRLVAGTNDKHLDFRVVLEIEPLENDRQRLTLTTILKRHNFGGRAYLAAIMPFHRAACRGSLRNLAKART